MNNLSKYIIQILNDRRQLQGINTSELANRLGMSPAALRAALRGDRNLIADEFLLLCVYFRLEIKDFYPMRLGAGRNTRKEPPNSLEEIEKD